MPQFSPLRWLLPAFALLAGLLGVTAAWVAVAVLSDRGCGWMALVAAADAALLLRLTQAPAGWGRTALALATTLLAIAASQWLIVATQLGFVLGLEPMSSAHRLGPVLAWALTVLHLTRLDWLFIGASLPLAAWWAGGRRRP